LISTILHRLTTNVQSCLPISPAPGKQKQQYLSIFCPVFDKEIQLSFKNKYEQTTIVKYGLDYVLYLFRWLSGFVPMVNMPNPETK
jgi:hypothetical protein